MAHKPRRSGGKLSIICPVYNEKEAVPRFHARLMPVLAALDMPFEVLYVDDGSNDGSAGVLDDFHSENPAVKVIRFSRNFGHQVAITAGLDLAQGDVCVVIDTDGQDPPETIPRLLERWREGFEVVYAVRARREQEGVFKRATAALFYRLMGRIARIDIPLDAGDFRLMDRRVVDVLKEMRECHRFVRGMTSWAGFPYARVEYSRQGRLAGSTHYPLVKMLRFAADGITSFSHEPLRWVSFFGVAVSIASACIGAWAFYVKLFTDRAVPGWTSMMGVILFLGGVQMMSVGVLGEYLGRIFDEVKRRPLYVIREAKGL